MVPMKMSQNMGNNGLGVKLDITHGAGWNLSRVTENRQVYLVRFQAARWFRGLIEDYSFVFVDQDTVFQVESDGFTENEFLQVTAFAEQITDGIAMADPAYFLMDDGAVVEHWRHIMCGSSDELYAAGMSLMVRACAGEGGQEGMMDVDDRTSHLAEEIFAQNLHVTGQNDQIDMQIAQNR
jgi:hypothetical protein